MSSWPPVDGGGGGAVASVNTQVGAVNLVDLNTTGQVVATHLASALPLAQGGTGQVTAQAAIDSLSGVVNSGKYLRGNGIHGLPTGLILADAIDILAVGSGGTGVGTLTPHGVLLGEGTSAVAAAAAMTDGQLLVGATGADPAPQTVSGDATLGANGALTIAAQAITAGKIGQLAYCFLQSGTKFAIPSGVYTPLPLDSPISAASFDSNNFWNGLTGSTTIGSGSNAAVLPQATIDLAPGGIAAAGITAGSWVTVNGPPGASTLAMVLVGTLSPGTGPGGQDQLLGCTQGTGTLATGQVVKPANVGLNISQPGLYIATGCVEFAAAAAGIISVRFNVGGAHVGENGTGNPNVADRVSCQGQPVFSTAGNGKIQLEMLQTSGSAMTIPLDSFQAPAIGLAFNSHN